MASVTASCTRAHADSQCGRPTRPLHTNMIAATAPNESQNPGRQHRPRIDQHHDQQRGGEHHRRRFRHAQPQGASDHAQHVHRALRRHGVSPPGARKRTPQPVPASAAALGAGSACRQSRGTPPEAVHQREDQARHHRHVQAGNAHQVVDAGAREDLPLIGRDRALIADGERGDHPGVGVGGQRREYAGAQGRRARARPSTAAGAPSRPCAGCRSSDARSPWRADCAR